MRFGFATSASTRSTVLSTSSAMESARLSATKLLPSLGSALVTITQFPRVDRRTRLALRVRDDRALEHAELVGDLRAVRFGRDIAGGGKGAEVDLDQLAPATGSGRFAVFPGMRTRRRGAGCARLRDRSRLRMLCLAIGSCRALRHARFRTHVGGKGSFHACLPELLQPLRGFLDDAHRAIL